MIQVCMLTRFTDKMLLNIFCNKEYICIVNLFRMRKAMIDGPTKINYQKIDVFFMKK